MNTKDTTPSNGQDAHPMSADVPSKEAAACILEVDHLLNQLSISVADAAPIHAIINAHFAPLRARIAELTNERDSHKSIKEAEKLILIAEIEENTTLRTAANQAARALEAVMSIYAIPPQTPAESENFDRGAPLTKRQVYDMQLAYNALRAAGVSGDSPTAPTEEPMQ